MITVTDLTAAQFLAICNGCGAKGGPFAFVRPPKGHDVTVCYQHDLDCWVGGRFWSLARWRADWRLLVGMLRQSFERRWWQTPGFIALAIIFWIAVRCFSWLSFHYGEPRGAADLAKITSRHTAA